MHIVQALHWLKDTLPADKPRIVKRLTALLDDPVQGDAIRHDLLVGFHTLPAWMQAIVRELPGCDPQSGEPEAPGAVSNKRRRHGEALA